MSVSRDLVPTGHLREGQTDNSGSTSRFCYWRKPSELRDFKYFISSFAPAPEGETVKYACYLLWRKALSILQRCLVYEHHKNIVQNKDQTVPCLRDIETHEDLLPTTTILFCIFFLLHHYF